MTSKDKLVSIIVPVYNVESYLKECLDSLVAQSYKNLEIIVVDDGSTDNSGKICNDYAKKYTFIRVFHQKNAGLSAARNTGIEKACGKFICFVDSDDTVSADYVAGLLHAISKYDTDVSVCGYNDLTPDSRAISGENATIELLTKQENLDIIAWNKLYRRSLFTENKIRYPVGKKHEDNLTTYKLYAAANRVAYVDSSLYYYRARSDSIMGQGDILQRLQMRELAAKEAIDYFTDEQRLAQAAEISLLTAKFAFIDTALTNKIQRSYFKKARGWILKRRNVYTENEFLSKKLRLYIALLTPFGGLLYILFRKIKH